MSKETKIIVLIAVIIFACVSISLCCLFGIGIYAVTSRIIQSTMDITPTEQIGAIASTITPESIVVNDNSLQNTFDSGAYETLLTLESEIVPQRDMRNLAMKFGNMSDPQSTVSKPPHAYSIGDEESFWTLNYSNNEYIQIRAILRYATPHAYYWIQDSVDYEKSDLIQLAETFESRIYPINREFFGEEWNPGVDLDEHIYILYASGLGENVAGIFPTENSYVKEVFPYSNEHEIFMIDASQELNDPYTYGVIAHEFQHMIHWYRDLNEDNWLNEGMADLAIFLNGYEIGGFDYLFADDPDIQLNFWPEDSSEQDAHYGASFLFVDYILDRFGETVTKAIVASPENGFESIDSVFRDLEISDPLTHEIMSADQVFSEWTVTNYLLDPYVSDGRYTYHNYDQAPAVSETEILACPLSQQDRYVSQYGTDYVRFKCAGDYLLNFTGQNEVKLTSSDPYSGSYAFWSNIGDESDMTLSRMFDLSGVSGSIAFSFWTAYDIEDDYDYLYLLASENGKDWEILDTTACTTDNPTGANYGCGYTGSSDGWILESGDLTKYAGKSVYIQFEYITDAVVSRDGFLIDDISIPVINYFEDFENGEGGWEGEGFVRIQNKIPQSYSLSIIRSGARTEVEHFTITGAEIISMPMTISQDEKVILVVSGLSRYMRTPALYSFSIETK